MMTKEYICGVIRCRYGAAGVHYNRWRIANEPHFSVMAVYAHYIAAEGGVFDTTAVNAFPNHSSVGFGI